MGRLFTSFDEAWRCFLLRDEPLEDFFAAFPARDQFLLGWLLRLDDRLVPAVSQAQAAWSDLDWITSQPGHFLHTWLAGVASGPRRPRGDEIALALERARSAWRRRASFTLCYRRVNCFDSAVVVEAVGDGPRLLVEDLVRARYWRGLPIDGAAAGIDRATFLPHLTIGLVNRPSDAGPLREALAPLRGIDLGRQRITEATLCVVPISRTTILEPWEVVGSVSLSDAENDGGTDDRTSRSAGPLR